MKPHHNVFFYYRGPTRSPTGEPQFDLQLENNTTKALINLLELGDDSVRSAFLSLIKPGVGIDAKNLHYRLQSDPSILSEARERIVVPIINHRLAKEPAVAADHQRGLPDALVYALPELGVLVESKVSGGVTAGQLERHAKSAGWKDWQRRDLTWAQVHAGLSAAKPATEPARTLLRHFLDYLEMIGMTDFAGLKTYDFDFFVTPDDQYQPIMRGKLQAFGEAVYARLPNEIRSIYDEGPYIGRIRVESRRGAWLGIRKKQGAGNRFEHCNFTIEITESAISINAVVRDGRATDKRKPIGALDKVLREQPGALLDYLRKLAPPLTIRVSRRQGEGGKKLMPGNDVWHLKYTQTTDVLVDETMPMILGLINEIDFPGVHLRREIPRSAVLQMSGDQLVQEAVETVRALFPFLYLVEHRELPPSAPKRR